MVDTHAIDVRLRLVINPLQADGTHSVDETYITGNSEMECSRVTVNFRINTIPTASRRRVMP